MASLKFSLVPLLSHTKIPRLKSTGAVLTQQFADKADSKWKFWGKNKSETTKKVRRKMKPKLSINTHRNWKRRPEMNTSKAEEINRDCLSLINRW